MKQHVRDVMPSGIQAIKPDIDHMRNPGYRMPITGMFGCKSPEDIFQFQSCNDVIVVSNIISVIIIDKGKVSGLIIDGSRRDDDQKVNPDMKSDRWDRIKKLSDLHNDK